VVDHSKRVSARENVQAFYSQVGRRVASSRTWFANRPFRRFLRGRQTITWLSVAGIVLSVGALMVVIGLGEAQIAASEGHTADLSDRPLFFSGLIVAGVGICILLVAVAANSSQATARREFPKLEIHVESDGADSDQHGNKVLLPQTNEWSTTRAVAYFGLVITNHERDRTVSLTFRLRHRSEMRWGTLLFGPPNDGVPSWAPRLNPFPTPLHIEPERTEMGDVIFDLPGGHFLPLGSTDDIVVFDHGSATFASLPAKLGSRWEGHSSHSR
jgi:hypothetical protein